VLRTIHLARRFLIVMRPLTVRRLVSTALALAELCVAAVASAQWIPNGVPVCDLPLCGGNSPLVCTDGGGGAFVVWVDGSHYSTSDYDVAIQHLTASGAIAPGWPAGGIILSNAPYGQAANSVVPDGAGGALVVWGDYNLGAPLVDLYATRVTASGALAPGWTANGVPVCTAPRYQDFARAISDGAGGAIIVWYDERNGSSNPDIYAQHLTGLGTIASGWIPDGLPICATNAGVGDPTIGSDGSGGAFIAWGDGRNDVADVYAQHITGAGDVASGWVADGNPIRLAPGGQGGPVAVPDGAGGAFIAWGDGAFGCNCGDWYLQRVTGSGALAPGWPAEGVPIVTAPQDQLYMAMVSDGLGGVLCSWDDYRPVTNSDVYAKRITASGAPAPGWGVNGALVSTAPSYQFTSQLAPDGAGGAFIVFESLVDGYGKIFAQHLTGQGAVAPGWRPEGVLLTAVPGTHYRPSIAADGFGGAITAWEDGRHLGSNIFAQRLVGDGPVPIALALVSAAAEPGRVVLTWFAAASNLEATLYRRTAESEWQALGLVTGDGSGHLLYEDRAVSPNGRYAYRLGYREQGAELFSAETWVEVPAVLSFALDGLRPNPAVGELAVSFTLPSAAPTTLALLDVSGRRLIAREVGSLGPGRHLLRLGEGARFAPGIYWLRLTQAGRVLTASGVVVR
jgi:hypothetical protein